MNTFTAEMSEEEKEAFKILNDVLKEMSDEEYSEYQKLDGTKKIAYILNKMGLRSMNNGEIVPIVSILDDKGFFVENKNWLLPFVIAFFVFFIISLFS